MALQPVRDFKIRALEKMTGCTKERKKNQIIDHKCKVLTELLHRSPTIWVRVGEEDVRANRL